MFSWETLMCWGDSITFGARSYLGYPEYIADLLEKVTCRFWQVANYARSGYTAIDLLRYVTADFANLIVHRPNVLTLLIGTNDAKSDTAPEDFRIAFNQLLIKARLVAGEGRILLLGIPEFPPGVMYPYRISMNVTIGHYNEIIAGLAQKHRLPLLGLHIAAGAFFDGVHLNSEGSQEVARQVAEWILQERELTLIPSS